MYIAKPWRDCIRDAHEPKQDICSIRDDSVAEDHCEIARFDNWDFWWLLLQMNPRGGFASVDDPYRHYWTASLWFWRNHGLAISDDSAVALQVALEDATEPINLKSLEVGYRAFRDARKWHCVNTRPAAAFAKGDKFCNGMWESVQSGDHLAVLTSASWVTAGVRMDVEVALLGCKWYCRLQETIRKYAPQLLRWVPDPVVVPRERPLFKSVRQSMVTLEGKLRSMITLEGRLRELEAKESTQATSAPRVDQDGQYFTPLVTGSRLQPTTKARDELIEREMTADPKAKQAAIATRVNGKMGSHGKPVSCNLDHVKKYIARKKGENRSGE